MGMDPVIVANFLQEIQWVRDRLMTTQRYYENRPGDMYDEDTGPDNDQIKHEFYRCSNECYEQLVDYLHHMALHRIG